MKKLFGLIFVISILILSALIQYCGDNDEIQAYDRILTSLSTQTASSTSLNSDSSSTTTSTNASTTSSSTLTTTPPPPPGGRA